jgi:hypothetical protein
MGWVPDGTGGGGAVAVEDDTVEVVAEASRLNFGDGLAVTDDGGGAVTIDATATGSGGDGGAYGETVGDGTAVTFDVAHGLGTTDVVVACYDLTATPPEQIAAGVLLLDVDTVRIVLGTAPAVDGLRVVVSAGGGGGVGGDGPLAQIIHNPSTVLDVTTTSATHVDIAASILVVTFTAPASGSVTVELDAFVLPASSDYRWGLREGTTLVAACRISLNAPGSFQMRGRAVLYVAGLTPGASYTWKWSHARPGGSFSPSTFFGNDGLRGPGVMTVRAAP